MLGIKTSSLNIAFGKVLRDLRLEAKLSQEDLGLEAEIQRNYISLIELGHNQPTVSTIFKLSKALKIKPAKLIQLVDDEFQSL